MTASGTRSRRVCIIQPVMKAYRVPFFVELEKVLAAVGIRLEVVYLEPWQEEAKRGDNTDLPPPLGRRVRNVLPFRVGMLHAAVLPWLAADLVIIEHANKELLSYPLMMLRGLGLKRLAFWGHGSNRQRSSHSLQERFKRRTLHWADWWFAYTVGTADYVAAQGFDRNRITVVENAVDTKSLRAQFESLSSDDIAQARAALGWSEGDRIGVYCGSLYENKRLDILFAAADRVHARNPLFRLLIMGGGPLEGDVRSFVEKHEWARYIGPKFGRDKAMFLSLAEFYLNPGLVGLGILDAFCACLPLITTDLPVHSPEIEYQRHGVNGLRLPADVDAYAEGVESLLRDDLYLAQLRQGALDAGAYYTIETMVENFSQGVKRCLGV